MADPLRRTLLAKLRGKKSKKGTTAGGCGVAANGGREALIENAHREASSALRAQLNTITVSKKRNWLQQSSAGPCPAEEVGPGSEEYHPAQQHHHHHHQQHLISSPPPASGISPEGQPRPAPFPRPALRLPLPLVTITHGHSHARVSPQPPRQNAVDAAEEENDADDEGEIWYNPIPEDDEAEPPKPLPLTLRGATTVVSSRHQGPASVAPEASQHPYPLRRPSGEAAGDGVAGPSSLLSVETAHTIHPNAAHSSEPLLQLHRQMFACKPQEESLSAPRPAAAADTDMSNAGFSAPSSPNPAKKGSSLNWSFPDKIKSPRTVRKLSMKMKKLPELSRKLSVKGTSSSSNNNASSQSESRAHSPKTNGGTESGQVPSRVSPGVGQSGGVFTSGNVISRYHLDSSVSTQPSKKKSSGGSKSASKGGYLSDGDSPELVAKSGKHGSGADGKNGKAKEREANGNGSGGGSSGGGVGGGGGGVVGGGVSPKLHGSELDIDAFRPYSFAEQPKCATYLSGLMSVHFYGAEDLKPPRVDSRDVYCAIQVDSVNKARTALLTCRTAFLDMDHTFNIELENAQHLKLVVFSWEATPRRHRVCCHGTVALPALFRVTRTHQLAVRLEPRGMIYVKLGLIEQWQNSLDGVGGGGGVGADGEREPQVFGVEAWRVVEREAAGLMVPLLIHKCITEIERRGCQVVGLYRLCGSAAVKKELREAFERDSYSVELSESAYPDVNVITGVLKDYLRELPYPLITKQLYEAVLDSMARRPLRIGAGGCENDQADTEHTVGLLDILPEVEKVTLRKLLDHLKLVASHHEVNKMTCQNLAVCFGPVLLSQRQDASCHSNRVFIDSEELASALHFKKHIEVLHYLLQLWPVVDPYGKTSSPVSESPALAVAPVVAAAPLRRRKERPQVLNLSEAEMAGVLRPKAGRLDSPSNRYAGDWSCCQETYFRPKEEADYDDVPSEESERPPEDKGDVTGDQRRPSELEEAEKHGALTEVVEMDRPVEVEAETQREGDLEEEEEEEEEVDEEEEEEDDEMEEADDEEESRDLSVSPLGEPRSCEHILLPRQEEGQGDDLQQQHEHEVKEGEHLAKEHTYQAYMKIQDISPVLSNRVNLKDLQESIDILIGNLERELNKNKLNVGY
ncbi:rho GTPase-activating protein SYDE2 isoform X2 [Alosa pseudoharengus]|uniref:rho GTPase-activating protein SYDE2 isoform X2 n=1 Tax=Alosa pseudoharengus TaxID=34774 RepID=UPI003F894B60